MFEEELFNLSMRTIGGILKGTGKFAAKAAMNSIDNSYARNAAEDSAEPLPPVTKQLTKSNKSSSIHGFVFGEQLGQVVAKDETADGHIMVVGGVGSGKSSCIAIPSLLAWNKRVFAIDIKGELYAAVSKHRAETADNIRLFNPLDKSGDTFGYDPFYLLGITDNQSQEAQAIAHALIPLPQDIKDPFWIQSAQNLFTGAILHFYNSGYSFIDTITKILSTRIDELIDEIYNSATLEARFFIQSLVDMDIKTLSGIFTELSNNIMIFATDRNIKESLSRRDNITPEDLEYGADIYIHIPEHLLRQWKNLLTLMVSQFLRHFEQREENISTPILFLLDEFARLGKIEGITDGLATLRSKKITICIILQSLAQLDLLYGKETRQVIADTCQYKAILNATDAESQQYFSKLVGTYEKYKVINSQQFERFTNFKAGSNITQTTEEKPIIKPEEFATLKQIVLLSPFGVFKIDKKPYYESEKVLKTSAESHMKNFHVTDKVATPKKTELAVEPQATATKGKITFSNGDIYEGEFINNIPWGKGKLICADGNVLEGEFVDNEFVNGTVSHTYDGGTILEVDFVNGKPHGNERLIYPNGAIYEGNLINEKSAVEKKGETDMDNEKMVKELTDVVESLKGKDLFQATFPLFDEAKVNSEAGYKLGLCAYLGIGMEEDPRMAALYIEGAAMKGHPQSMNILSYFYHTGYGRIEKNTDQAAFWAMKGNEYGSTDLFKPEFLEWLKSL